MGIRELRGELYESTTGPPALFECRPVGFDSRVRRARLQMGHGKEHEPSG